MTDISISIENPKTVQRPATANQRDEGSEIIPSNRQSDDATDGKDTSDGIPYIFLLNFVIILILSFIAPIQRRQNVNLVYEHVHFSSLQSYQ